MTKKPRTFSDAIRLALSSKGYTPLSQTALFRQLKVSAKEKKEAKKALDELIENKEVYIDKATSLLLPKSTSHTMKGILRMNPRGFGFVIPEDPKRFPEDAFIAKHCVGSAVDGDLVEVELFQETKKDKGPEGKIVTVIERGRSHLGGIISFQEDGHRIAHAPLLGQTKPIRVIGETDVSFGDRVILKILDWGGHGKQITAEVSQLLGSISDATVDIKAASEEFQIPKEFSKDVIKQAKSFGVKVSSKDCAQRMDLTQEECFTIDPETARDFDDALSLTKGEDGLYHLGVHIADVAHYVKEDSPLDEEAKRRANSTYFPGACLPMLPEELSNNLCSLKPKVVRLTASVLMTFNSTGDLLNYTIARTFIKSARRFTYEEAKSVIDGKKRSKHKKTLNLMVELCLLLKAKRYERGSIDFSLPEVVLKIGADGVPSSYHIVEYDITHQLVEEYMLKANEVVAKELIKRGSTPIFRVHEEPAQENREEFFMLARSLGFALPGKPETHDIQKLFEQAKATPFSQQLSVAFIRSMRLATYSSANVGHYGLALEEYCHFTSPIRRYPDLIIQRLLFGEHTPAKDVQAIADSCSSKERVSFKAESSVKILKKLRLLQKWHEADPDRIYECQITKIRPFGLSFELAPLGIEGSLHVSEIGGDYFVHEPSRNCFFGRKTHVRFCVGDPISLVISSLDLILLEVVWERVSEEWIPPPKKKHKKTPCKNKNNPLR